MESSPSNESAANVSTVVAKIKALMGNYFSDESREKGIRFTPAPEDVILVTAPKSRTTWMQQICHGLRSTGDMSFEEICLVFPELEHGHDAGYTDLQAPQPYSPRMYKTHLWYPACPKGAGKYIVVVRRPADAAVSFHRFFEDWFYSAGEISVDDFVQEFFVKRKAPKNPLQGASHWHFIMSWYPHRFDKNVLWLHFEDLKENLRECVRLIADFLDIGKGDDKLQELVTQQASLDFMKKHTTKFDEHILKHARNEAAGLPKDAGLVSSVGKVHTGEANGAISILSKETLDAIDAKWTEVVTSQTGHKDYNAFRASINKELGRSFLKT